MKNIVIPIDGTTASGKNYLGIKFAEAMGFKFLDSGWIFRLTTFAALEENISLEDEKACVELLKSLEITCESHAVDETNDHIIRVGGLNVMRFLFETRVDNNVSQVAKHALVRENVKEIYLRFLEEAPTVLVGRDIGTVVFPDAPIKFFINADLEVRAIRRLKQRGLDDKYLDQMKSEVAARDLKDSTREIAPLKKANGAIEIWNNGEANHALEQMIKKYEETIKKLS